MPRRFFLPVLLLSLLLHAACTVSESSEAPPLHPDTEQGLRLIFGQDANSAPAPRDTAQGRMLLEQANADGDAAAARWLGVLAARRGDSLGARQFYQTAAARGDSAAFVWESMLYLKDEPPFNRDLVKYVRVKHDAAQSGNVHAQQSLARTYDDLRTARAAGTPEADSLIVLLEASNLWPDTLGSR